MFVGGSALLASKIPHVHDRVEAWLHPFQPDLVEGKAYQIAQGLFAQADGGLFGRGFGQSLLEVSKGHPIIPAAHTDLIYAVIVNEVGLFGAILVVGLLFAARGFKTATLATDGFSKLLAVGLTTVFALQVFVIVGGVTKADPAHGRHAAVRLLRRQLDRRELHPARPAAHRVRQGPARSGQRAGRPGLNRQIARLFALIVVLFGLLVVFTSRWSVFEAKSLQDQTANRRPLLEAQRIPRGLIYADDGTKLAVNRRSGNHETLRYSRIYPTHNLFSHAVGYAFISRGSAGLEKSYNRELTGQENEFKSLIDSFSGGTKEGDDVHTTLDPAAQRAALAALAGRRGSIVALDPSTGAVKVMASVPNYDPNQVPTNYKQLNSANHGSPLFNRATQARYPPGSTFKVVTAAAALDSGRYTPDSIISGKNNKVISGVPLQNFGGEDLGPVSLTDALTHSINTVFGEIGEKLGKRTMYKYMGRFGFNSKLGLDLPSSEVTASGVFKGQRLLGPNDSVDIGRVAIGQERLQVTRSRWRWWRRRSGTAAGRCSRGSWIASSRRTAACARTSAPSSAPP